MKFFIVKTWTPICAGVASWMALNRNTIHGDYALLALIVGFGALYTALKHTNFYESAFATSVEITLLYIAALTVSTVVYRLSPYHPLSKYPGPLLWRMSSIVLALVSFRGRRHLVLHELHERYGTFVRVGPNTLSINSSKAGSIIYGAAQHMLKDESYSKPGHIEGVALFFKQKQEDHSKRKRIWAHAFTRSSVANFFPALECRTTQLIVECIQSRASLDGVVDIGMCIAHWSYDFMGEMVFGGSNNLELMRDGDPRHLCTGGKMAIVVQDSIGQTPWLLDLLWHLPASEAIHRVRVDAATMMRNRFHDNDVKIRDLSSFLIEGDTRTGDKISLWDLEIEAVIAIAAGSDNTSSSTIFSIFFLLTQPETYKSLQAELDEVFPDDVVLANDAKLASIPLLDGVINEALRLGTPFYIPRIVPPQGVDIDGEHIPGGQTVALAAYSQQISKENFYPEPMEFRPKRWLPGGLGPGSVLNSSAIWSFSIGPYICVAKNFAIQELRYVIARLVLSFDMSFPPEFDQEAWLAGIRNMRTTIFDKPLLVKQTPRRRKAI